MKNGDRPYDDELMKMALSQEEVKQGQECKKTRKSVSP